jgi:hypothetical protein
MAVKKTGKSKRKPTPRQMKLIKERAKGKNAEAAVTAGSAKNARQSGYQAMEQLRGRVPDLLDKHGLSEDALIDKYLRPLLKWEETILFQKDGKVTQKVRVADGRLRHSALRTAFELHGSYAPNVYDKKGAGPGLTLVFDPPRPNWDAPPINVMSTNGSAAPEKPCQAATDSSLIRVRRRIDKSVVAHDFRVPAVYLTSAFLAFL